MYEIRVIFYIQDSITIIGVYTMKNGVLLRQEVSKDFDSIGQSHKLENGMVFDSRDEDIDSGLCDALYEGICHLI